MVDTSQAVAPAEVQTRSRFASLGALAERSAIPIFLLVLVIFFGTYPKTSSTFFSAANIQNILANQSVTGLIALGMVIPLVAGYFDLSVSAIAGLSNVVFASLVAQHGQSVAVGVIAGLAVGVVAGAVNATLVAIVKLNPFITTLGTYILIGGLLQLYTKGQTITNGFPLGAALWSSGKWLGIARPFWLLMVVAVVLWFLLIRTPFGRKLAAIGSNESAARLAGIRVDRAIFITFLLSGLLGGMAGVLLTLRDSGGDATTAISFLFSALAAVFLGLTAINPGHYNVWGTIFGVFFVAVAVDGFILLGANSSVTAVFNGAALILSVTFVTLLARARERRARASQLRAMRSE